LLNYTLTAAAYMLVTDKLYPHCIICVSAIPDYNNSSSA